MMRARLIYNPTSGQEIIEKYISNLLNKLESYGYETSTFATTADENSARDEAIRCCEESTYDLIVAAGGDGTINEVVNGMMRFASHPKFAIIPTGTTNDFARALKIPRKNPVEAVEIIGKNQTLKIDVGRASRVSGEKYFINIAAAGALSELSYSVPSNLKTVFGYLAYMAKGVELLPQIRKAPIKIVHDSGVFKGKASMIFIALTNSVGGFEQIAPDAKLDDGLFTVIIVKTDNLFEILALLGMIVSGRGRHMEDKNTEYIKTRTLEMIPLSNKCMQMNLDGEYGGEAPVTFENLKCALEIFVNLDEVPDDNYLGDEEELAREVIAYKFMEETENLREGD